MKSLVAIKINHRNGKFKMKDIHNNTSYPSPLRNFREVLYIVYPSFAFTIEKIV